MSVVAVFLNKAIEEILIFFVPLTNQFIKPKNAVC